MESWVWKKLMAGSCVKNRTSSTGPHRSLWLQPCIHRCWHRLLNSVSRNMCCHIDSLIAGLSSVEWGGLWETWSRERYPCPWQMIFNAPSNSNHPTIIWFCDCVIVCCKNELSAIHFEFWCPHFKTAHTVLVSNILNGKSNQKCSMGTLKLRFCSSITQVRAGLSSLHGLHSIYNNKELNVNL